MLLWVLLGFVGLIKFDKMGFQVVKFFVLYGKAYYNRVEKSIDDVLWVCLSQRK